AMQWQLRSAGSRSFILGSRLRRLEITGAHSHRDALAGAQIARIEHHHFVRLDPAFDFNPVRAGAARDNVAFGGFAILHDKNLFETGKSDERSRRTGPAEG